MSRAENPACKIPKTGRKPKSLAYSEAGERARAMEEDQIEKFVVAYLKKKGFKQAEHAFQEELQQQSKNTSSSSISINSLTDPDLAKRLLALSEYSLSLSLLLE